MTRFDSLIRAINHSICQANQAVMNENEKIFDRYFEQIETHKSDDDVRTALDNLTSKYDDQLSDSEGLKSDLERLFIKSEGNGDGVKPIRAKTIDIQYPHVTPEGVEYHNVRVPMLAVVPISSTEISEVRIKTKLEMDASGNDLKVAFAKRQTGGIASDEPQELENVSELEIVIKPTKNMDGLKTLISSYEKVLKAQIP